MTGRERILACMENGRADRLPFMPITMMFAADLVGKPYGQYAADHRVLAEGQLRVAERFGADFVSTISDPAREAADCGARVVFFDDQPPALDEGNALLADTAALAGLKVPDPLGGGRMTDRIQGLALLRERVGQDLLVEGWVEGPCALAADLRGINAVMMDFFEDPGFATDLMTFCVETALGFAREQIAAGADLIGLGDAAASLVGPSVYEEYVWPLERRLVEGIQAMGGRVRLHICGNTTAILEGMGRLGCEIVDLDYMVSMAAAREAMGPEQTLLGNIEPAGVLRNGTPEAVRAALAACHGACGDPYIVGAGCEVVRDTPHANLDAMAEYARAGGGS